MKRQLWIMLALAVLTAALCCGAAMAAGGSGSCGDNVTWSLNSSTGVLTVSGTGPMWDYNYGSNLSPLKGDLNVKSLVVQPGVTGIGKYFLWQCSNLTSVSLPDGLLSIGNGAFQECALSRLDLPDTVTSIGSDAFYGNNSITSLKIPENLTVIGRSAFNGMRGLTSVTFPEGLKTIGESAFTACTSLNGIEIPAGVTAIVNSAFSGCSSLSRVTVLSPDASFGTNVFLNCHADLVIYGWNPSTAQTYAVDNSFYFRSLGDLSGQCGDSVTWTYDPVTCTVTVSGSGYMQDYDWVSSPSPFSDKDIVRHAVIGSGVRSVGNDFFHGCENLESVSLPSYLYSIGSKAFYNTGLTSVSIPYPAEQISENAFAYCEDLTDVRILYQRTAIGENAFSNCAPGLVISGFSGSPAETYAADNGIAFNGWAVSGQCGENINYELSSDSGGYQVTLTGSGPMWDYTETDPSPFAGMEYIASVTVRNNITTVGVNAFRDCSNLKEIDFFRADAMETVGAYAFCNTAITRLVLRNNISAIGDHAFENCGRLEYLSLPDQLTGIGESVFANCTKLTEVSIPDGVTAIGNNAFSGCAVLEMATIFNYGASIAESAFSDFCADLVIRGWPGSTAEIYADDQGISFEALPVTGRCGDSLTWSLDVAAKTLTISGTGAMWDYQGYGSDTGYLEPGWYYWNNPSGIRKVIIENGVTAIGAGAFVDSGLTSVTIPDSVITIGEYAFSNCINLTAVAIPGSVTSIGYGAFIACSGMTSLTLPDSAALTGEVTFHDCYGLADTDGFVIVRDILYNYIGTTADVTVPDGITRIVDLNNSALTSIIFPASVTRVRSLACYSSGLKHVVVLNPDTELESTSLYCEYGPPTIHGWAGSTAQAYAEHEEHTFVSLGELSGQCGDSVFWEIDPFTCTLSITGTGDMWDYEYDSPASPFKGSTVIRSAVIGSGVTGIGRYVFCECANLTEATIPKTVKTIGDFAFALSGLTGVTIPNSVTEIGEAAFNGTGLTGVTIPNSVKTIGKSAFASCAELTGIVIPDSVTSLGSGAFIYCTSLANVSIPASIKTISESLFECCTSLTSVTIPAGITGIGGYAFYECTGLTDVTIPVNVTSIGSYAFHSCSSLKNITIPDSVTDIGLGVFAYSGLTSITIPDGMTRISGGLCGGCSDLTSVTIPDSVTSIGNAAFRNCVKLTDVTIPAGVTTMEENVFEGCSSLTGITIPAGVTRIGDYAFRYCSGLTRVTIQSGVTAVGRYAFRACTGLTGISLPASVTLIGDHAFDGCSSLASIAIHYGTPTFSSSAFAGCSPDLVLRAPAGSNIETFANTYGYRFVPLAEMSASDFAFPASLTAIESEAFYGLPVTVVYIPDTVTSLGSKAFAYCTGLTQIRIPGGVTVIPPDVFQGIDKSRLTIFGEPGSAAETFAGTAGIAFEVE